MAQVNGQQINQATGTFAAVNSGITETGNVDAGTTPTPNAFSLQLNSNWFSDSPLCTGASDPSDCSAWQQFLYLYNSQSEILMQYWIFGYSTGSTCPPGFGYAASEDESLAGCYMNSQPADVPSLTAGDLASVALSGAAAPGGSDEVSMSLGSQAYAVSASDSVLGLAGNWDQTEWGVYGDADSNKASFGSDTTLEAQTSIVATGGVTPTCATSANVIANQNANGSNGLTNESNNLSLATTPAPGNAELPTITSLETNVAGAGTANCAPEAGYAPSPAAGLAADGLNSTWQAESDQDSTGSPQPLPTTTSDCGNWSGADGTQVVGLANGDDLWSFGDTFLGPAVARQDFFNNGFIENSMVLQDGSSFTTITGGSECASSKPTTATAPITDPNGNRLWPSSSIVYGSNVDKFYYSVNSDLVQQDPEVAPIPQADLESGDTYSAPASVLSGCNTTNPIMWGTATISSGGYTYIYGSQQYSGTGGDVGGNGGELFLARTSGDPSEQDTWEYYTTGGWSPVEGCLGLVLAPLGGSEPIEVPTAFSVTSVNGNFWLVDEDPVNGDDPGWAVAHEATTPTGFSNDLQAAVVLFDPGQTGLSGIDDSAPGLVHYSVGMLEPSAVTPTQSGDVVIDYQVNDSDVDYGCISLLDYDANAYRPRFVDVPIKDLAAPLYASSSAAATASSTTRTEPVRAQLTAAVSRAGGQAAASEPVCSSTFTYDPDTVPTACTIPGGGTLSDGSTTYNAFSGSCPAGYPTITGGANGEIVVKQNKDGSLEVSWPNLGPDVWYWFYWQDDTSDPGVWNKDEYWTEGPNADGYFPAQPAGATVSTAETISQLFTLPPGTNPGDTFSFWVEAFAAGNANVTSNDTSTDDKSDTPTSPSETVSGLTATAGTDAVSLTWTAAPAAIEGQSIWYSVRYKPTSSSTWTYDTDYIFAAADMTPLTGGTKYEFEVAVTDYATVLSSDANWSAAVDATPKT